VGGAVPGWWLELSQDFLRSLRRANRRPNTEATYRSELSDFGGWLLAHGIQGLNELRGDHIEAWQDELHERLAPGTQHIAATALRRLLKWAAIRELPLSNPTLWLRVTSPRVPPLVPRPIPGPDLAVILRELGPAEPGDSWRLRTRALFQVIYSSGARINEALALQRNSFSEGSAVVIQKGGRQHTLLISEAARRALADYEAVRRDGGPALFASLISRKPTAPLRRKEAQKSWNRLCHELGIAPFTSHRIRHSCATTLRRKRVDIVLIAKHMGHRDLQTIMGYSEVDMDERRQAVAMLDTQLVG